MRKIIKVRKDVLAINNQLAAANRALFATHHLTVLNLLSSPGSGKTALLVRTLTDLKATLSCQVVEGDQQTDNDAQRIAATGVPVVQLNTLSACHLDAKMVQQGVAALDLTATQLLFIENVGNMVCPAAYDLGETLKIALLSVTEGEDKPIKYPKLFRVADVLIITKMDLLPYLDFDLTACLTHAHEINPKLKVFTLSVKTGEGLSAWYDFLQQQVSTPASNKQ